MSPERTQQETNSEAVAALRELETGVTISAQLTNRTHRVVRERAKTLAARRTRTRSLYLPLAVSAVLVAAVAFALWSVLDQYEVSPNGLPDASQQLMVLTMWCLPVSTAVLAVVWFRKAGNKAEGDRREGVR